jgi:hypothetical protein
MTTRQWGSVLDQVQRLLEQAEAGPVGAKLRALRAVEVLEHIGAAEARQLLARLAQGAPGARLSEEVKASADRLAKGAAASR